MMNRVGWALAAALVAGSALAQDEAPEAEEAVVPPSGFFDGWTGNFAFGLFGSSGNTERLNVTGRVDGLRESEKNRTSFLATYSYATDDGDLSQSQGLASLSNDFLIPDSKWFGFVRGVTEYDEFQAWDGRIEVYGGPGYVWVNDEVQTFITRLGFGAELEIGSSDTAWRPIAVLNAEYRRQLTERQELTANVDGISDLSNLDNWRFVARGEYRLLVDPEVNMSLVAGAQTEYDADPQGAKRSDVDYYILLSWEY
ncbi:MAG: DUF481 domain-containing protein [Phycisphaerales bacterium]